ncbi:MAG: phosphoglucosamine mutase [Actinomycetota bacterium]|nr:phosphoglucosamine mutase [Actinomycetota bacterium]
MSGTLLQAALSAGLMAEGMHVADLGILPTPGVAWLSAADGHPAAVISASHNPFHDNGIKFFAGGGRKLSDEVEARLEAELDRLLGVTPGGTHLPAPVGAGVGTVAQDDGRFRYVDKMVDMLPAGAFAGLTLVLDCANGAAWEVGPEVFRRLGATVHVLHDVPDGRNINHACGSTDPAALQAEVVARGADAGLAFDGDADRVLAVDASGQLVDGDQLIALLALDRKAAGRLPDDTVVVTVLANLGFRQAMRHAGITMVETDVGDRYVLEALEKGGWSLGGEQSGHVIFRDLATTGDGILTGLQVLDVVVRSGRTLAELASVVERLPQVLRNVPVASGRPLDDESDLNAAIAEVEASLGDAGRVLIRPSGTEPVIRVMVEAETMEAAEAACETLCQAVRKTLGS